MTEELDAIDIAILRTLQQDASLTNKELAARVHLSSTPVFERVKRLESQGYIRRYVAVLDAEKLDRGFMAFCYIKLSQLSFENANRFMEAVNHMDEIVECYNISGEYDFLLKIHAASMKAYQSFVLRILGELECIGSLHSSFVMGEVKNTYAIPIG